jgi:hypothetical protein
MEFLVAVIALFILVAVVDPHVQVASTYGIFGLL